MSSIIKDSDNKEAISDSMDNSVIFSISNSGNDNGVEGKTNEQEQLSLFPINKVEDHITKTRGFALASYSINMTRWQKNIFYDVLRQIDKNDDLNNNTPYYVNAYDIAKRINKNSREIATAVSRAAKTMPNPELYFENTIDDEQSMWVRFPAFSSIEAGYQGRKGIVRIKLSDNMRRLMIIMKKQYDIIYPFEISVGFKNTYCDALYDLLLTSMHDKEPEGEYYKIHYTVEELAINLHRKINQVSSFNRDIIIPCCKEINDNSQIYIENSRPDLEYLGSKIVGYVFKIKIRGDKDFPFAIYDTRQILPEQVFNLNEVPPDDFIRKVLLTMGVEENFIKYVIKRQQNMRAWKSILYTKIHGNNEPRFFNRAYQEYWAEKESLPEMLSILKITDTDFSNPIKVGYTILSDKNQDKAEKNRLVIKPMKIKEDKSEQTAPEDFNFDDEDLYKSAVSAYNFCMEICQENEKNGIKTSQTILDNIEIYKKQIKHYQKLAKQEII